MNSLDLQNAYTLALRHTDTLKAELAEARRRLRANAELIVAILELIEEEQKK